MQKNTFLSAHCHYSVVSQIACYLDRNSLHHLAQTCRQFYATLVPHRSQLVKRTLKCINDDLDVSNRLADGMRESLPGLANAVMDRPDYQREGIPVREKHG